MQGEYAGKAPGRQAPRKPLRLWPGIILVVIQWILWMLIPLVIPGNEAVMIGVAGGMLGGLSIVIWWAFFSRSRWYERVLAILLMAAALFGASFLLDESIATANMGLMFWMYSIPITCLAFVGWSVMTRRLPDMIRRVTMIVAILLASGFWIFLRSDGMDGDGRHSLNWRWAGTDEALLIQSHAEGYSPGSSLALSVGAEPVWPGFRGPGRDGIVHDRNIGTEWSLDPPEEMWRRAVGPGCSSFAAGDRVFFTQEQRGEFETVSCYALATGEPVWQHRDSARFWDSHAGAGPRSTPALAGNRVYTLGATGLLNALNAGDGSVVWSHNAARDAGIEILEWGFTGSPLVHGDLVIVALAGKLAAYDTARGELRWSGPGGIASYSSPHLATIGGVLQVLHMNDMGLVSLDPVTGKKLWEYSSRSEGRILQPAVVGDDGLLLSMENTGVRRISVSGQPDDYKVRDIWTSGEMNVAFNDHVIHNDYAYGFDGPCIACLDLKNGRRMWKGERYRGWILLLAGQDLLLILTERGDLALVRATPDRFSEVARIKAIEGKTWNHPAIAGDVLLVRNSREMAAFRLPPPGVRD